MYENKVEWYDLPRLETTSKRLPDQNIGNDIVRINLDYGINVYRNALKKENCFNLINNLENILETSSTYKWSSAKTNEAEDIDHARNCYDFKYKAEQINKMLPEGPELIKIHDEVNEKLNICLRDYESLWHLRMQYVEAFNFVKYMTNRFFKVHVDHGPYYSCTISAVMYLNDDYSGGEIKFTRHGLQFKPEAGDLVIFPSNFVYEHSSEPITEGTKYAVVIMTDYNDLNHKNHL